MRRPSDSLRVLLLVLGDPGGSTGPELRGIALARALAERHDVTVVLRGDLDAARAEGLRVVPYSRLRLAREALRHDVAIAPSLPPYLMLLVSLRRTLLVSDQYDPVELELSTLANSREIASAHANRRLQLRFADVVVCAGPSQLDSLRAELASLGQSPSIAVVPFGIPAPPLPSSRRPLRDRFNGINEGDIVVLWWGSIWRWLDASTALRAFAALASERPDLKLVITAGRPPAEDLERFATTAEARSLASELGVLDRNVFFLDEWVPYAERHEYLRDADIGLTLHAGTPEAKLAARARYMDYLWAGLPPVLARGDDIAEEFAAAGFATLVPPHDVDATRAAILAVDTAAARQAGERLAREHQWEAAVRPLDDAISGFESRRRRSPVRLLAGAGAFYLRRTRDEVSS